jgi:hypothetical protein
MDHYHTNGADFGTILSLTVGQSCMSGRSEPSSTIEFVPCTDIGRPRAGTGEHTGEMVALVTYNEEDTMVRLTT